MLVEDNLDNLYRAFHLYGYTSSPQASTTLLDVHYSRSSLIQEMKENPFKFSQDVSRWFLEMGLKGNRNLKEVAAFVRYFILSYESYHTQIAQLCAFLSQIIEGGNL